MLTMKECNDIHSSLVPPDISELYEYKVIEENPFADDMMYEFKREMDIGLSASIVIFEYTSTYEITILNTFPGKLGENMLRWVCNREGMYRRHVIFRPDNFSVCYTDGSVKIYPYGSSIVADGEWVKVIEL